MLVYFSFVFRKVLLVCTWRHGGHVGGQEQKHFSPLGTKLYFHVNSSRKYSFVLTPNMAALSRGCKPRTAARKLNRGQTRKQWGEGAREFSPASSSIVFLFVFLLSKHERKTHQKIHSAELNIVTVTENVNTSQLVWTHVDRFGVNWLFCS